MKVLKHGSYESQATVWSKKVACTGKGNGDDGCGAELEIVLSDVYKTYRHFMDGSTDHYHTFCCPDCGAETDLPDTHAPRISGHQPSEIERQARRESFRARLRHEGGVPLDHREFAFRAAAYEVVSRGREMSPSDLVESLLPVFRAHAS